jgi:hypothetical protein
MPVYKCMYAEFFRRTGQKVFPRVRNTEALIKLMPVIGTLTTSIGTLTASIVTLMVSSVTFMASLRSHGQTSSVYDILRYLQVQSLQAISLPL